MSVTVVVLGDLGRSPRMLNHALMLAEAQNDVTLIGYDGAPVDAGVSEHPRITIRRLPQPKRAPEGSALPVFLAISLARIIPLYAHLTWLLVAGTPRAQVILVQNPPSIPTLMSAWVAARLRGSRLVVDWHNLGYSMLALRLGDGHLFVRLARMYERAFGRLADGRLCVSRAMAAELPKASVVYDRPRLIEHPLSRSERRALAERILRTAIPEDCALLVSPTSWTADEPMEPLIEALDRWEGDKWEGPPRLLIAISGRGPMREQFERRLANSHWKRAEVRTMFLDPESYRDLLRCAEMGLCFHRSSSGVDLPMKVMDLFGAGAPVCALNYGSCLSEQIEEGSTGLFFTDGSGLAGLLKDLFGDYPAKTELLDRLRLNVGKRCRETSAEVWRRDAMPVLSAADRDTRKS